MSESFTFTAASAGVRIDKYLTQNLEGFTRSAVSRLIDDDNVVVNGKAVHKNYKLKANDSINVFVPDAVPLETTAENIPLDIVYEDDDLLVVNKPKDMVVHPAAGNYTGTLVNALLYHCKDSLSGINGVIRPGIVHRIDKDTSGILIIAKNDMAHLDLAQQIKEHSFHRAYEAVVYGNIKDDNGTVHQPIGRNPKDRKKMAVTDKNSKDAVTHYEVIKRYGNFTHIRCVLETGRTHQIRVHMAYIGHPLVGDWLYGTENHNIAKRQMLHSCYLCFTHPITGQIMEFKDEMAEDMRAFIEKLS